MSAAIKATVRMYRQGLGDCFLLTFTQSDKITRILIDCGVVLGAPNGVAKTKEVVQQLAKDCDNKLDIVVATHEHWDHVSGFATARAEFEQIEIGHIWMAWTEDPKDPLAKSIRKQRGLRIKSLALAADKWKEAQKKAIRVDQREQAGTPPALSGANSLLDFFGPGPDPGALGAKGDKTREALDFLKEHDAPKTYLNPGDEERIPRIKDVRVYVLGPPRDYEAIKKDSPSKREPETYEEGTGFSAAASFLAAAASVPASSSTPAVVSEDDERYQPFDGFYRISAHEAETNEFFKNRYGFSTGTNTDSPQTCPSWRRIEEDWLSATSELALMLDSDTNNTSLVLAFELGDGGDVLLFAADAQVGNWKSWADVEFARPGVTAADLLRRTAFYKVGHHASHNATLRDEGLELMKSRRLAAFIPVDQQTASNIGWKKMPFNPLLKRLQEKCRNRVVRLDKGVDKEASKAFTESVTDDPLFFEIELSSDS
jgi:hypothetical protein